MASSSTYDELVRQHPAFKAGFDQGRDVGLVIALNIITNEWARQVDAGRIAGLAGPRQVHPHEYTAGRLLTVGQRVAGVFRTAR
jgi:hypothetical protein